jgi:hypothetical protein
MKTTLTVAAMVGLLATAAFPAGATANYDPLASGSTKLTLARPFLELMKRNGIEVKAAAPARLKRGTVTLPVTAGKFDPVSGQGEIDHEGALVFKAGKRSIPLRFLRIKTTQRRAPLTAKVGGSQLKLATAASLKVGRAGFGDKVSVRGLELSAKLATRLGKKLDRKEVFAPGQALGELSTVAQPETVTVLDRGAVSFTFDPGFEAKLRSLFVAVNPIFPAEHPGPFTLPIFGGLIAPSGASGRIETEGSLELLQLGGGQLFWASSGFDLAPAQMGADTEVLPAPPYAGKLGFIPVGSLDLAAAAIASNPQKRTVAVQGARVVLNEQTAATLNELFAKPQEKEGVFVPGETLATASFSAQTQ